MTQLKHPAFELLEKLDGFRVEIDADRERAERERDDYERMRVVLADGYSCRTQIADLSDSTGVSLAELLAWGHGLEVGR